MKLSSSILIIAGYLVAVDGRCRKYRYTTQELQPPPQLTYNSYQYNSNEIFHRNAAIDETYSTTSLKNKHHPSLSCLLFGEDGCQLSCNLMCDIHGCRSEGFCQNRFYCVCNELYFIQNQALTADQFKRLSLEELWNYKFVKSPTSSKVQNRILQDNALYQYVLPLLQNPHKSGYDIKSALLNEYPQLRNVQNLKPRDHGAIANPFDDNFNLQRYVQDMINSMQKPVYDRIHHVRYMRRIINLIKNIKDEDDLLYILTQLSNMGNERLYERVRRYLIKQGYYFVRDHNTGQVRKKGRCKKSKKKKPCKCKKSKPKRFVQCCDFEGDDLYDETDEAVEIALINELINSNDTDGQFPIFNAPDQTPTLKQDAEVLVTDVENDSLLQQQPYPISDVQNDSLQQQTIAYSQVTPMNDIQETIFIKNQPTNYVDTVAYPSNLVQQEIVPSNYQTEKFLNSQPSQSLDSSSQTFIQSINTFPDDIVEPVIVQQSPLMVNSSPSVQTFMAEELPQSLPIPQPVQPSVPLTIPNPSISNPTPIKLEAYDISDGSVEKTFIKHQTHQTTPQIEVPSYAENLLSDNVPIHTQTISNTPVVNKQPESYAYYLLSGDGDLGSSGSTSQITSSNSQSHVQTIIPQQPIPSTPTVQKGKDKIYYQLLMDENGNIIKSANYKYPGQVQYPSAAPIQYTTSSSNQIDQSLLERLNKQDLLNAAKSKNKESILIDYNMENSNTLPHFHDIDHIHQMQNVDSVATDYNIVPNEHPSMIPVPSSYHIDNSYDTLKHNLAYNSPTNAQIITAQDWKPIPIDNPSLYHENKPIDHSINVDQNPKIFDNQISQTPQYFPSGYNAANSYDTHKNMVTDYSLTTDQDYQEIDYQNMPPNPKYIPIGYNTDNTYNSANDLIIDYVSDDIPINHFSNGEALYLENDIENSQIKSSDGLTIDYEIDHYDSNNDSFHHHTDNTYDSHINIDYSSENVHTIQIESGENIEDHDIDIIHVQSANNVADRYPTGFSSHSQMNGMKTIQITGPDHGSTEHSEIPIEIECDDLVNPEDDLMNY